MSAATPLFFSAPWVVAGQLTVSPDPRVQTDGDAFVRYLVKFDVVPEPSERCTTAMGVEGSVASGLSALISAASQVVMVALKMPASVSALNVRSSTPSSLNEIVMGAPPIGKYRT